MKLATILFAASLSFTSGLSAQTQNFLDINSPDILGESVTAPEGEDLDFRNQIEIINYSFNVETNVTLNSSTGGPASGRPNFGLMQFTGFVGGRTLPDLIESISVGNLHDSIVLTSTENRGNGLRRVLQMTLTNCLIASVEFEGTSGDRPVYNFSVIYSRVKIETFRINPATGENESGRDFEYDVENNQVPQN